MAPGRGRRSRLWRNIRLQARDLGGVVTGGHRGVEDADEDAEIEGMVARVAVVG